MVCNASAALRNSAGGHDNTRFQPGILAAVSAQYSWTPCNISLIRARASGRPSTTRARSASVSAGISACHDSTSAAHQRSELHERNLGIGLEVNDLVQILDLAVARQHDETVAGKGFTGQVRLPLPI